MNQFLFSHVSGSSRNKNRWRKKPISLVSGLSASVAAVARESFVKAMRGAATGVNIVTTDGPGGRFGLTVSAFSSVSAEPPTVLVCINRQSPACKAILENRQFCVNVLSTEQQGLADTFAGMPADGDAYDFSDASVTRSVTGALLLDGSVASFDCRIGTAIDAGTHTIFIGLVRAVEDNDTSPLLYTNRSYRRACCDA